MKPAQGELVNKTFRLRLDWIKKAEKRAIDEQRSLTDVVAEALERYGAAPDQDAAAQLIGNARSRAADRLRQLGGRFHGEAPLSRDQAYER